MTSVNVASVNQQPDEEEEAIFRELYSELLAADTRSTRSRHGRDRAAGVHRPPPSTSAEGGLRTYARRGSSSSNPRLHDDIPLLPHDETPLPREPFFDDDGNLLSEIDPQSVSSTFEESSSEDSLDGHSRSSDHVDVSDDVDF